MSRFDPKPGVDNLKDLKKVGRMSFTAGSRLRLPVALLRRVVAVGVGLGAFEPFQTVEAQPASQRAEVRQGRLAAAPAVVPFPLESVRLLAGPFRHAQELDHQYLLSLDPDRLLFTFRLNAGLPTAAQPLGGWEEPACEVRGHFLGHYLTACSLMYASTGDERLRDRTAVIVEGLAACQEKLGSGYLSAYPESFIDRVEKQERVWAPYYTLHKILAGLLDTYVYCRNENALAVCRRFADWVIVRNGRLTDDQMQRMLDAEHGGMNEVLANLYATTGEPKYLEISLRFNHQAVVGPASQRQDRLTGLHANTQIPKFVGTARQYELTGDPALKTASLFFWETVVKERSYVIGGHSDNEHFSPKERLSQALGPSTTETCNTYNMLKLTRHLFGWDPRAEYADYYERALLNHILASQNPADGMTCYYVPLRSGLTRGGAQAHGYGTPLHSFWCCTGTGVENHAKYADSIYFWNGADALYVNQFIASELRLPESGVVLRQETRFPEEDRTRLLVTSREPHEGALMIRHPAWATAGVVVTVNGAQQDVPNQPGTFIPLRRSWRSGDRVEVSFPFVLRTEGFRDNPDRFAFLHGPVVLCAQVPRDKPAPAVVGSWDEVLSGLQGLTDSASRFATRPGLFRVAGEEAPLSLTLEPFYQMHGDRPYATYWDRFSPDAWQVHQAKYRAELVRQMELAARTTDVVQPGEPQSETDHALQSRQSSSGQFGDRKYRHSLGGWFSYELKVRADQPQALCVTYWGSDAGRAFEVLVDGQKLLTQRLEGRHPDQFFDEVTPLPESLVQGKQRVTVRFVAPPGGYAGGVFGLRILKP